VSREVEVAVACERVPPCDALGKDGTCQAQGCASRYESFFKSSGLMTLPTAFRGSSVITKTCFGTL
jgi:hypothetical protein